MSSPHAECGRWDWMGGYCIEGTLCSCGHPAPLAVTEGEPAAEAQSDKERPPAHLTAGRRLSLCYVSPPWAYFTTQPLAEAWGDDWNDAPYEHNAEEPYEWREGSGKEPWEIVRVAYWVTANMETPADLDPPNSGYSVQQINAGEVAWMTDPGYGTRPRVYTPLVWAGFSLAEFRYAVESRGGTVYTADIGRSLPDSAPVAAASKTREPGPFGFPTGADEPDYPEPRVGVGEEGAPAAPLESAPEPLEQAETDGVDSGNAVSGEALERAPGKPSGAPDGDDEVRRQHDVVMARIKGDGLSFGETEWRDVDCRAWTVWLGRMVECPGCGFCFGADHTDGDGDGYTCPVCFPPAPDSSLSGASGAASSPGNTPAGTVRAALERANGCRGELWKTDVEFANALAALDALVAETELLRQRADKADSRERELIGLYSELVAGADALVAERDEARAALTEAWEHLSVGEPNEAALLSTGADSAAPCGEAAA